jgi:hypothetical protein
MKLCFADRLAVILEFRVLFLQSQSAKMELENVLTCPL